MDKTINKKIWQVLAIIIWAAFFIVAGLIYYVNHYLPHGPSYPTGEYACGFDDRGPCVEEYKEDLRNVNIPNWAKFLRRSEGMLLLFGLGIAGAVISSKSKNQSE